MPTPIAHALMGATVTAAFPLKREDSFDWRLYLFGGFLGAAPDLDCLLGFLPFAPFAGRNWHHDFAHSLGFAFLCGALFALLHGYQFGTRWRTVFVFSAAMASHSLLDCMFTDSAGVELFWPFSHANVRLELPPLVYIPSHHSLWERLVGLVLIGLQEIIVFGSFFLLVWLVRRLRWRKAQQV
jgi:membrane-bound metal-dependent hydrolase YbcI (DUF457 family)